MHRRLPMPKSITFSLEVLLMAVPSAVRNRSGRNSNGSPHSSLQEEQRNWDIGWEAPGGKAWRETSEQTVNITSARIDEEQ